MLAGIELLGAGAHVARAVALGARVAGLHDPPAPPAPQQALQQGPALAHRAAGQFAGPAPIAAQPCGVGLVGLPGDESGMVVGDEHLPLLARHQPIPRVHGPGDRVHAFFGAGAAEHKRPGVGGVGQQVVHRRVGRRCPGDPPGAVAPPRQQHPVFAQPDQHLPRRAEFVEAAKHRDDRLAHRLIGGDHHPVVLVVVQADRKSLPQFAFGCLVFQPGGETGFDQMQLGLRHGALEPQHESVVEIGRVIDAVGVGDQGVGDRAQIQQLIPVGVVAGQPRHLDAQHDPDLAQPDVGDQLLEPDPPLGLRPGAAQVSVDHHHLVGRPAQRNRTFPQFVLAGKGFGVLDHLRRGGLAHIHVRVPGAMRGGDLVGRQQQRRRRHARLNVSRIAHLPATPLSGSARAPLAISLANSPNTWHRISSGRLCHRLADTGKSTRPSESWHGAATLNARKWVHLSCSRERDQGRGEPTCASVDKSRNTRRPKPLHQPVQLPQPRRVQHRQPRPAAHRRRTHPSHQRGSCPASHPAGRPPAATPRSIA